MFFRAPLIAGLVLATTALPAHAQPSDGIEFFERKVRPVLVEHCQRCHGADKSKAHLRLDSRAGVLKGGDSGAAVTPGEPGRSLLLKAVRYEDAELRMPPRGKLPDEVIADLARWVGLGAPWPDEAMLPKKAAPGEFDLEARSRHWSLRPLQQPPLPEVKAWTWPRTPIDTFILARLEEKGLSPAPPADPRTLLRRITFDLIGLPPTPEEIDDFVRACAPDASLPDSAVAARPVPQAALERVVDRLLASPHYGERWGRHWLDLVRFAETLGHEFDFDIPDAWRYRDYVVRAFNQDLPFDQLVLEHVAGDLLETPRRRPQERTNESILGAGFWWLGEAKHAPVDSRADQADRIDNQIDVFGKTFLGLTIACARCHDHKFDAISTQDYYALAGYLQSSRQDRGYLDDPRQRRAALAPLRELHEALHKTLPKQHLAVPALETDGLFAHFAKDGWGDWFAAGEAFGGRPSKAGDVMIDSAAAEPIGAVLPGWAHSGLLSLKLQGALRSPTFTIAQRYIHYRVAGRGSKVNLILNGLQLIREPIYGGLTFPLESERPHWRTQDLGMWLGQRAYIELLDEGPGYAALEQVVLSDDPRPPAEPRGREDRLALVDDGNRARVLALVDEFRKQEALVPPALRALATADGNGVDEHVFIRGNAKKLGPLTPRRFLEVFGGTEVIAPKLGSGRLELARQLVDPRRTPILPRVLVNRLWKHHFGEGIVRSPDDFGVLGQAPTHPELLDFLASAFVKSGWSIKKMHRMMVLSATYQQSSSLDGEPRATALDPDNKLLSRMPVRRLEAEAIRDAMLAVSGRLDRTVGGPSVPVHLTPFMVGRGRPVLSGPLDGAGRRSLYVSVRRNFLTPIFTAFDYPTPFSTMGRRSVSNVPAQALTMLNNPLVLEQARRWAKGMLAEPGRSATERLERMYAASLGRPPSPREREQALAFVRDAGDEARAWSELAHVLFNLKEFIYVR